MRVPPTDQLTKEWIRLVIRGDKKFCTLLELKPVSVGNFPELSVKALWDEFSKREALKPYLPPKVYKDRYVDKSYFFDILNTFCHDEFQEMLQYANH